MGDEILPSRWGPEAGRKGSQAWYQSVVPTRPGWREFSGSGICNLRTCLYFCNFYLLHYGAEGKPKGNKVPFRNACLCRTKWHMKRESTFCGGLGRKKRGSGPVEAREMCGRPHPVGKRQAGVGRKKRVLSAQAESRGSLSALIVGNHTDLDVNPNPTTA